MLADKAQQRLDLIGKIDNRRRIKTQIKNKIRRKLRRYKHRMTRKEKRMSRRAETKLMKKGIAHANIMVYNGTPQPILPSDYPPAKKAFLNGVERQLYELI